MLYEFETTLGQLTTVDGYSYYVYDYATAQAYWEQGTVILALSNTNDKITTVTDSVPLDYMKTVVEDDAAYLYFTEMRNGFRAGTLVTLGAVAVMVVAALVIPATAKKATAEQLAENHATSGNAQTANQSSPDTGIWRCGYCGNMNDSSKHRCDGCGAKRQK